MKDLLHSIRNGKILTQDQLNQISSLTSEQKQEIITAYNETVKGLSIFIQELLSSLQIVKNDP